MNCDVMMLVYFDNWLIFLEQSPAFGNNPNISQENKIILNAFFSAFGGVKTVIKIIGKMILHNHTYMQVERKQERE